MTILRLPAEPEARPKSTAEHLFLDDLRSARGGPIRSSSTANLAARTMPAVAMRREASLPELVGNRNPSLPPVEHLLSLKAGPATEEAKGVSKVSWSKASVQMKAALQLSGNTQAVHAGADGLSRHGARSCALRDTVPPHLVGAAVEYDRQHRKINARAKLAQSIAKTDPAARASGSARAFTRAAEEVQRHRYLREPKQQDQLNDDSVITLENLMELKWRSWRGVKGGKGTPAQAFDLATMAASSLNRSDSAAAGQLGKPKPLEKGLSRSTKLGGAGAPLVKGSPMDPGANLGKKKKKKKKASEGDEMAKSREGAEPELPPTQFISVMVRKVDGTEQAFSIQRWAKLQVLFELAKPFTQLSVPKFTYRGSELTGDETPFDLSMEDHGAVVLVAETITGMNNARKAQQTSVAKPPTGASAPAAQQPQQQQLRDVQPVRDVSDADATPAAVEEAPKERLRRFPPKAVVEAPQQLQAPHAGSAVVDISATQESAASTDGSSRRPGGGRGAGPAPTQAAVIPPRVKVVAEAEEDDEEEEEEDDDEDDDFDPLDSIWAPRATWCDAKDLNDTQALKDQRFQSDWDRMVAIGATKEIVRSAKAGADGGAAEVEEVRQVLHAHHEMILLVFAYYATYSYELHYLTLNAWTAFVVDYRLAKNSSKFCKNSDLDRLFIAVDTLSITMEREQIRAAKAAAGSSNVMIEEGDRHKALSRVEFLSALTHLSIMKYVKTGEIDNCSDALERLLTMDIEAHSTPRLVVPPDIFRRKHFYTMATSYVLQWHENSLRELFHLFSLSSGGQALVGIEQWRQGWSALNQMNADLAERDFVLAFSWSRMGVGDNGKKAGMKKDSHLPFEGFIEAICRLAMMKALPTDEEIVDAENGDAGTYLAQLHLVNTTKYEHLLERKTPWGGEPAQEMHRCLAHFMSIIIRSIKVTGEDDDGAEIEQHISQYEASRWVKIFRTFGKNS